MIVNVKKLWEKGDIVAVCNQSTALNCNVLNMKSAKDIWIVRTQGCCGSGIITSLSEKNPNDPNALKGVWVESKGDGIVVDVATVDDLIAKCNGCCGDDPTIAGQYNGVIPDMQDAGAGSFCVTRSDDGSAFAIQNALLDYQGKYVTMTHKSTVNGVSKYNITADSMPTPIGTDAIASGICQ
jgi:hypothetical protein